MDNEREIEVESLFSFMRHNPTWKKEWEFIVSLVKENARLQNEIERMVRRESGRFGIN